MGDQFFYMVSAYGESKDADYGMYSAALPINVEDNPYSINAVGINTIQVPLVTEGALISIIYAAYPRKVTITSLDDEVEVPDQFVEPLLHYIGYRAHGSMDGNIQTESNTHYMRFEKACDKLKELGVGIVPDDIDMNNRLNVRGFL
jgi:hypothetical protein